MGGDSVTILPGKVQMEACEQEMHVIKVRQVGVTGKASEQGQLANHTSGAFESLVCW